MILHYILKCVADALFLASLNLGNSNVQFKDIAEVGATGRYIPFPLVCRWLTMPSSTPFGAYHIYTNGVGITLSRSSVRVFLGPKGANEQKPDTPLFFCSYPNKLLISPILGVWRTLRIEKMTNKQVFVASLGLNILLLIVICGGFIRYHSIIIEKLEKMAGLYESPTEKDLANFNNDPLGAINDSLMIGADSTITCLFLGNSLTVCGVPAEEPDKRERGLTSTSVENDYVHVLLKTISEEKHVNIRFSILNIAQFERTFTKYSFEMRKLDLAENKQPDYLFVQIGENVAKDDIRDTKKYEEEYLKLLSLFPNSKRIITIPFWPDKDKEYATTNVAIKSNSYLVDISHLGDGTDPMNFSSSYKNYANPAVGAHPGDYGMANIAKCIYSVFNACY